MANTTRAGALSIHGTNPQVRIRLKIEGSTGLTPVLQYLIPTVIRKRVYDTLYWSQFLPPPQYVKTKRR